MQERNGRREQATGVRRSELPPLDLLRSFEACARRLNFTHAAQDLFLTQSAVSRQIQQLEASLGIALFERRHRSLVLTESGVAFQRVVVDCLERLRDVTARVRAARDMLSVAIACTPGFASLWLIPRLAHFTVRYPAIDVRISATSEVVDLERQRIDVAVRYVRTREGHGQPLFEETVAPVCSPELAGDRRHPLRKPADLERHTLLAVDTIDPSQVLTADWEPWFRVMGLEGLRMKNTVRFTRYSDAVAAAVEGQGVVIGRLPLLADLLAQKRLMAPFGRGAASQLGYYVELGPAAWCNADARAFAAWLQTEAESTRLGR